MLLKVKTTNVATKKVKVTVVEEMTHSNITMCLTHVIRNNLLQARSVMR